jgi:hypothetical protein
MRRPALKLFGACAAILLLVLLALLSLTLRQPAAVPAPPPRPNGYDDFVKAGRLLSPAVGNAYTMPEQELRALLASNTPALSLVRTGLTRQCRVPMDYSPTNTAHISNLALVKRLAQGLAAQGRLAELEHRPADAAECYLVTIRLGQEVCRGGVIIDSLVGLAVEAIGLSPLEKLVPKLDAVECRKLATALETAETNQEPAQTFVRNDELWGRRTYGWRFGVYRLLNFRSHTLSIQRYLGRYSAMELRTRVLVLALASRAYELDHGRPPANPAELVPGYLQALPQTNPP